ncbi:putative O-glycosylation ligase, exosortase A system-associated [Sulfuricella sp.]|uniref:putative O-glycosylation ligase, exosortase A system-associated n=1 Tax=Sulfuricella sp. TaxID=2099377 RepID=UPI002CE500F7|nr:putative O-glycosylation ligase, exosortase A system-associated [Sulfuricella sp.]HUX65311.1 putative O-glycosylation ligase, exosortase A system-associated [Sulfuricella sp.]
MPIRDIFVTFVVFVCLPFILANPYIGIYVWSWMSYMNPHRLSWGFAFSFPFAYIIALTTLAGMLFSREPKPLPQTRETLLLLALILWMLVTTVFAFHQELAWTQMEKIAKIQLMIFLTLILITTRERLQTLVWVIALSLAFYGVKGGIFTIIHGGIYAVRGPLQSFIGGDNEIGLALIMTIPLLRYLQLTTKSKWIRLGLTAAMILSAIAVIGSQSRGAMLGAAVMGGFLWLKSRNKFFTGSVIAVSAMVILAIMPEQWFERMSTIKTYEQDDSAQGRINAWKMAFNLASDRPLVGGGFETFQWDTFRIYAPDPENVHAAHSIYFQMLGEHGFVGLALFLALGIATWRAGAWIIKTAKRDEDKKWAADLAAMTQVSMVGFASAGAFLGLANFDLYYHMLCLIIISKVILLKEQAQQGQLAPHPVGRNASFKRRVQQVENG